MCILGSVGCGTKEKPKSDPPAVGSEKATGSEQTTGVVKKPDNRTFWKHENGHFEKLADGSWKEVAADGGHAFVETNRTADMIEITDRKRNIVVSLFNSDCTAKVGSNKPVRLYDGLWLEKPEGTGALNPVDHWSLDPTLVGKLATEVEINGYRIRPPVGWTLEEKPQGGTKSFNWTGPRRADGSAPRFWVMVGKLSPVEQAGPLDKGLATLQNPLRMSLAGYGESPLENGKIGAIPFLRISFKGVETTIGANPVPISGVVYHAHDGGMYIHIKLIDKQQVTAESFPMLEAAAKSLRKP